ncbi:MAG: hypothetical protein M1355_03165 [Patescibacteria group bacterium]|nr:hypothetical protein [Patescibacteria group bacterium]
MKRNTYIIIGVIVVLTLGGGYYFLSNNKKSSENKTQTTEGQNQSKPTESQEIKNEQATNNENPQGTKEEVTPKTYSNSRYSFSFNYPSDWAIETTLNPDNFILKKGNEKINVSILQQESWSQTLDQFFENASQLTITDKITVNGIEGGKYTSSSQTLGERVGQTFYLPSAKVFLDFQTSYKPSDNTKQVLENLTKTLKLN